MTATPNPFAGYKPASAQAPKTVRVTVRAAFGTIPWAGRTWGITAETIDAPPATVEDLLKAPPALLVTWPQDYVAPDGRRPAENTVAPADVVAATPAHRVAIAEDVAHQQSARAIVLERQLRAAEANHAAESGDLRRQVEELRQRAEDLANHVRAAETRAAEAHTALDASSTGHQAKILAMQSQHTAALDTARAEHTRELDLAMSEVETLTTKVQALEEEIAALKAAAKPVAPPPSDKGGQAADKPSSKKPPAGT